MTNFSQLKKTSGSLDRLQGVIENQKKPANTVEKDERFWKPTVDKAGNGFAIIRFLPAPSVDGDEGFPWVKIWSHNFNGPSGNKFYAENSLTTIGQKDPVSELNSQLWNSTQDDNSPARKQARDQKRKLNYYSNIQVISDPANPENDGKVFLFRYGKKIFTKIEEAITPPFDDKGRPIESPDYNPTNAFNPFDLWTGANFRLIVRKVKGYPNYDSSVWEAKSPLSASDEELEKIWKSEYSLKAILDPKNFKSYDELKTKLYSVLEPAADGTTPVPSPAANRVKTPTQKPAMVEDDTPPWDPEYDDELNEFRQLAL